MGCGTSQLKQADTETKLAELAVVVATPEPVSLITCDAAPPNAVTVRAPAPLIVTLLEIPSPIATVNAPEPEAVTL